MLRLDGKVFGPVVGHDGVGLGRLFLGEVEGVDLLGAQLQAIDSEHRARSDEHADERGHLGLDPHHLRECRLDHQGDAGGNRTAGGGGHDRSAERCGDGGGGSVLCECDRQDGGANDDSPALEMPPELVHRPGKAGRHCRGGHA